MRYVVRIQQIISMPPGWSSRFHAAGWTNCTRLKAGNCWNAQTSLADEVIDTIVEVIEGKENRALQERQGVPLTVLELVEIRGIGGKMARRLFGELGVVDLQGLRAVVVNGQISQLKGFRTKTIEKITAFLDERGV